MRVEQRIQLECLNLIKSRHLTLRAPLIEITNSNSYWGQWDSQTRVLKLSNKLLELGEWKWICGVLRHELAHQYSIEVLGIYDGHGEAFHKACERVGVPYEFRTSALDLQTTSLDWRIRDLEKVENPKLIKMQKLLSLANSSNSHEAELAMQKAQSLNAQFFIDSQNADKLEYVSLKLKGKCKIISFQDKQILHLLQRHFFVFPLISLEFDQQDKRDYKIMEIWGTPDHVLMAEYVYCFLKNFLNNSHSFQGTEKRSFERGLLDGFINKLDLQVKISTPDSPLSKALILSQSNSKLSKYLKSIHSNLKSSRASAGSFDQDAYQKGHRVGQRLTLKKPLENQTRGLLGFLSSSKSRSD